MLGKTGFKSKESEIEKSKGKRCWARFHARRAKALAPNKKGFCRLEPRPRGTAGIEKESARLEYEEASGNVSPLNISEPVIPVKTGIQKYQYVIDSVDCRNNEIEEFFKGLKTKEPELLF
jgi:hypothetical protein